MTDLIQVVDMTRPEADGLSSYANVNNDGQHYVEYEETTGGCDACDHDEPELVETEDGIAVEHPTVYKLKGAAMSGVLCREHLAMQPTHIAFVAPNGGGA